MNEKQEKRKASPGAEDETPKLKQQRLPAPHLPSPRPALTHWHLQKRNRCGQGQPCACWLTGGATALKFPRCHSELIALANCSEETRLEWRVFPHVLTTRKLGDGVSNCFNNILKRRPCVSLRSFRKWWAERGGGLVRVHSGHAAHSCGQSQVVGRIHALPKTGNF